MSRGPSTFRQQGVTRALKAASAAGLQIGSVEIDKNGKIVLVTGDPGGTVSPSDSANEWDTVK